MRRTQPDRTGEVMWGILIAVFAFAFVMMMTMFAYATGI